MSCVHSAVRTRSPPQLHEAAQRLGTGPGQEQRGHEDRPKPVAQPPVHPILREGGRCVREGVAECPQRGTEEGGHQASKEEQPGDLRQRRESRTGVPMKCRISHAPTQARRQLPTVHRTTLNGGMGKERTDTEASSATKRAASRTGQLFGGERSKKASAIPLGSQSTALGWGGKTSWLAKLPTTKKDTPTARARSHVCPRLAVLAWSIPAPPEGYASDSGAASPKHSSSGGGPGPSHGVWP